MILKSYTRYPSNNMRILITQIRRLDARSKDWYFKPFKLHCCELRQIDE